MEGLAETNLNRAVDTEKKYSERKFMIIENTQDKIVFDLPENYKNIGIKLSGGADSAIVLYMLCKYIP